MRTIRLFKILFLLFCSVNMFGQVSSVPTVANGTEIVIIYTNSSIYGVSFDNKGIASITSPIKYDSEIKGSLSVQNMTLIYGYHYAYTIYINPKDGSVTWKEKQIIEGDVVSYSVKDDSFIILTSTNIYIFFQDKEGKGLWKTVKLEGYSPKILLRNH